MLTAMGDVMREAHERGWITTRDGNVSVRMGKYFYVTPTGVRKVTIHPEDIAKIHLDVMRGADWTIQAAGLSIETEMHWLVQECNKAKAVVHLHPTYTVAAMHAGWSLPALAAKFVELRRYTRVGENVPYFPPGSKDLANCTASAIVNHDIVGQVGHGVTACGANPWDAFEHIERLEHICQIVLASGVKPSE